MKKRKLIALVCALVLACSLILPASAAEPCFDLSRLTGGCGGAALPDCAQTQIPTIFSSDCNADQAVLLGNLQDLPCFGGCLDLQSLGRCFASGSFPACLTDNACFGGQFSWYIPNQAIPTKPETSAEPETPSASDTPETPAQPEEPVIPVEPETPPEPEEPAEPVLQTGNFSSEAQAILTLVNDYRAQYGLSPLELDETLCTVAQVKARDMHDNRYFSHNSPTYGSPFDLMDRYGVRYRSAGENIAYGYATAQAVMTAWMNSEGHRANILNASYGKLGVGYVADGSYWVQEFTN